MKREINMKIKKFLILLCLLLLTGCSATYEINIKNGKITENLKLIESDKSLFDKEQQSGSTIRELFNSELNDEDDFTTNPYDVKSINTNDTLGIEYNSIYNKEIGGLSGLNQCYKDFKVQVADGIVTIETGNNFECYDYYEFLDSVKVVIKTNHKVIDNNADEKNGNSYIWNITKDGNKNIKFSYKETANDNSQYIVISIIIILFVIIALLFLKKRKKSNEI